MAKNKNKHNQNLSPENFIRQRSRALPIYECWVNSDWKKAFFAQIFVARKHTNGNISLGLYLVDLGCLGIKDTFYRFNIFEDEFRDLLSESNDHFNMEQISYELAHNIIFTALEYAEDLGFKPHKDFTSITQFMLEEDTDDVALIEIECGFKGKPFYVKGNDSVTKVNQVINHLERTVGKDNFDFIIEDDDGYEEDDNVTTDEFSDMSFSEKKNLFFEMNKKPFINFTDVEIEKISSITDELFYDLCDDNEVEELIAKWREDFSIPINQDFFTHEFLGVDENFEINESELSPVHGFYENLQKKPQKALKILNKLKDKLGNMPLFCFLELKYLEAVQSNNYESKLYEFFKIYPNYSMLKIQMVSWQLLKSDIEPLPDMYSFKEIFKKRSSVTDLEMFEYQLHNINFILFRKNLNELEAIYDLIEELDISESIYSILKVFILFGRIKLMAEYLEEN